MPDTHVLYMCVPILNINTFLASSSSCEQIFLEGHVKYISNAITHKFTFSLAILCTITITMKTNPCVCSHEE